MQFYVDFKELGLKLDRFMLRWGWPKSWRRTEITNLLFYNFALEQGTEPKDASGKLFLPLAWFDEMHLCNGKNTDRHWLFIYVSYRNNNIFSAGPLSAATTKSSMWFCEAMKSCISAPERLICAHRLPKHVSFSLISPNYHARSSVKRKVLKGRLCVQDYTGLMFTRTIVSFPSSFCHLESL